MRSHSLAALVAGCLVTLVVAAHDSIAQVSKPYGAATPQEAVAAIKSATTANDMLKALPVISPTGLKQIASEGITGLLMVLAFTDPDDAMPGSTKPSKTELDAQRKKYGEALDLAKAVLKPYGLDTTIGKPVLAPENQKVIDTALDKADNVVLITSLYGALVKAGPLLGMKETPKPEPLVALGDVTGYKISGDTATAQNGAETLQFTRIGGRWYIEPPPEKGAVAPPPSAAAGPGGQQAPPVVRPTASGKEPEVVVGGVQIARVVAPADEFSAKPFNADNGTTVVLWVKMPAGQGLIEIDEDASLLQSFGDDKGTNMGGKFSAFPKEFKDGSGGTIEIRSTGFAASGASAIVAEGVLTMTVAASTRKTRVAKVSLQNDAKFIYDKTPMLVDEVEAQGESTSFTLRLPRQVMETIRNVAFFDAKGEPIEGDSTGSGYMNQNAEMRFSVKTAVKMLTLEFEAWQGLRTIKVPFKVRGALGLD